MVGTAFVPMGCGPSRIRSAGRGDELAAGRSSPHRNRVRRVDRGLGHGRTRDGPTGLVDPRARGRSGPSRGAAQPARRPARRTGLVVRPARSDESAIPPAPRGLAVLVGGTPLVDPIGRSIASIGQRVASGDQLRLTRPAGMPRSSRIDDPRDDPISLAWAKGLVAGDHFREGYSRLVRVAGHGRRIGRQAGSARAAVERGEAELAPQAVTEKPADGTSPGDPLDRRRRHPPRGSASGASPVIPAIPGGDRTCGIGPPRVREVDGCGGPPRRPARRDVG